MGHNSAESGHSISTSFLQVDGWSTDPRVLRCHTYEYIGTWILRMFWYLDFTDISEISVNISGYFDKNIGEAKTNKNTLKFMKILC